MSIDRPKAHINPRYDVDGVFFTSLRVAERQTFQTCCLQHLREQGEHE